ncbi:MAG TPA: hypothetical protein VNY27_09555 [Solirubrobacteraceae bacterium]|jgi:hypothetical protein|nr:hypothetical protein [Solirubrobacteraceae bacterium]
MTARRPFRRVLFSLTIVTVVLLAFASAAGAAPVKEILTSHVGWDVNKTKEQKGAPQAERDLCTVESKDECQQGKQSSEPGVFNEPKGVASETVEGVHAAHVYVAERGSHRVQELTKAGGFVSMFGMKVDKTTGGNVCTAASGDVCGAGVEGSTAGQFGLPGSVAIDPVSGDVYVADRTEGTGGGAVRVEKFTPDGGFVLEIGREVNETTKGSLCTQQEVEEAGVKCVGPKPPGSGGNAEPFLTQESPALAVGGPEDLLYVGDEHRVQEFKADGSYKRELSLTAISAAPFSRATSLAVSKEGDVYLLYDTGVGSIDIVHRFGAGGEEVKDGHFPLTLTLRQSSTKGLKLALGMLAIDPSGRLAVIEDEFSTGPGHPDEPYGSLLDGATGRLITYFVTPVGAEGLAFGAAGELYMTSQPRAELWSYTPRTVAELFTASHVCVQEPEPLVDPERDITVQCALSGEVNPWGVAETEAAFQWGATSGLGSETARQPLAAGEMLVPVSAPLAALRPNQPVVYQLVAFDHWVQLPEQLTGEQVSFTTATVPPRVVGAPSASFVKAASAVMFSELNPEHANTRYRFQYAPCASIKEGCPGVSETEPLEAGAYGRIGASGEATGLQPSTSYAYRLVAVNEHGEGAVNETGAATLPEGHFTTAPASRVGASTGPASAVSATSALISGSVNPNGAPATFSFELGVYAGAATRYGVVSSGQAGAGTTFVEESLALSGLQPGTEYAYRITAKAGVEAAVGEPALFTTTGLPAVLVSPIPLAMLSIPNIQFPPEATPPAPPRKCKRGYKRDKHSRCVKPKKRHTRKGAHHRSK